MQYPRFAGARIIDWWRARSTRTSWSVRSSFIAACLSVQSLPAAAQSLQVTSPDGWEQLAGGSVHEISWTSSNLNPGTPLSIYYLYEGAWVRIATVGPSDTSYSWQVPHTPTAFSYVWIGSWANAAWHAYDHSDRPFTISSDGCGDERDAIIDEYRTRGVPWTAGVAGSLPTCGDFATAGGSAHFTWHQLHHAPGSGHRPLGIVKQVLWEGLEKTRVEYGTGPDAGITITSGYRCPHGNELVYASLGLPVYAASRHQHGEAVDMKPTTRPWNENEWIRLRNAALKAGATWIEPYEDAPSHVHAQWQVVPTADAAMDGRR
jgi:hypothetical protein